MALVFLPKCVLRAHVPSPCVGQSSAGASARPLPWPQRTKTHVFLAACLCQAQAFLFGNVEMQCLSEVPGAFSQLAPGFLRGLPRNLFHQECRNARFICMLGWRVFKFQPWPLLQGWKIKKTPFSKPLLLHTCCVCSVCSASACRLYPVALSQPHPARTIIDCFANDALLGCHST